MLTMDCRVWLWMVVVGFWLSCFGCRVLVVYFCVGVRSVFLISVSSSAAQYGLCRKKDGKKLNKNRKRKTSQQAHISVECRYRQFGLFIFFFFDYLLSPKRRTCIF